MSLCDFSFDSAINSRASVEIQDAFLFSKDMRLPWKFDLEHVSGKKKILLLTYIYSAMEKFPWILVKFSSD